MPQAAAGMRIDPPVSVPTVPSDIPDEHLDPALRHEDVAGGAFAGAAAEPLDRQAPIADDFHHPPALDTFEGMALAGAVGHMDDTHETGSPQT